MRKKNYFLNLVGKLELDFGYRYVGTRIPRKI